MSKGKSIYQKKLENLLQEISEFKKKPSLLLHACCGPCSSYVLEYLSKYFDITILYYNPNIYPQEEYVRRFEELKSFLKEFPAGKNIELFEIEYNQEEFYQGIGIKENPELAKEAEKGERCRRCYKLRLLKSIDFAEKNNFDYFCTTLSISPFKDAKKINEEGEKLSFERKSKVKWLYSDFKKNQGFLRSLELSEEYGLYRQEYCGCIFSIKN